MKVEEAKLWSTLSLQIKPCGAGGTKVSQAKAFASHPTYNTKMEPILVCKTILSYINLERVVHCLLLFDEISFAFKSETYSSVTR
jgi:hypothetical protein